MFNFFKKKKGKPENLDEVLAQFTEAHNSLCARFRELKENFEEISKKLKELKEENELNIQKVGIVRFNPFKEIGGNQSFSVALLDGEDNGVVITSLYTKEGNRVYGKPIKAGESEYLLSEEEKQAIEYAKRKKSKPDNSAAGGGGFGSH